MSHTPTPALSAERLAEIRAQQKQWDEYAAYRPWRAVANTPHLATSYASELLAEVDRLAAELARRPSPEAIAAELRGQLLTDLEQWPATSLFRLACETSNRTVHKLAARLCPGISLTH